MFFPSSVDWVPLSILVGVGLLSLALIFIGIKKNKYSSDPSLVLLGVSGLILSSLLSMNTNFLKPNLTNFHDKMVDTYNISDIIQEDNNSSNIFFFNSNSINTRVLVKKPGQDVYKNCWMSFTKLKDRNEYYNTLVCDNKEVEKR